MKVLVGAYACRPGEGSEPGMGWNTARELARHHEVWVLTVEDNRAVIEAELARHPVPGMHVVCCNPPRPLHHWQGQRFGRLHYWFWYWQAYRLARQLHDQVGFDVSHHVTYSRYCVPSFLVFLPVPFVWGPLAGGESAPYAFWKDFSWRGRAYEMLRNASRWLGEINPLVRLTARRSAIAFVSTVETATRVRKIGAKRIETVSGQGVNSQELTQLKTQAKKVASQPQGVRFLSMGRLLHWKGFHLGLRAFAQANLGDAEFWIVGEGPERRRLEALADQLALGARVRFLGSLPRDKALAILGDCEVLIHPSLHDFFPVVCLEAMAAGKPVLCLDLGGPSVQVTDETGYRIAAHDPGQVVRDMAMAMAQLATNPQLRQQLGQAGQSRVTQSYNWNTRGSLLTEFYQQVVKERD